MNTNRDIKRRGFMDCIAENQFNIKNRASAIELVEEMTDKEFDVLFEKSLSMSEKQIGMLLETLTQDITSNTNIIYENKNWDNVRDLILMESTNQEADQLAKAITDAAMKGAPITVLASLIGKDILKGNNSKVRAALAKIKAEQAPLYNKMAETPIVRQFLIRDKKGLHKIIDPVTGKEKIDHAGAALKKLKEPAAKMKTRAEKLDKIIEQLKTKKFGKAALITLAAIGGVVAVGAGLQAIYKGFFSDATKSCKGLKGKQKTICMLRYRISAADKVIISANRMLDGCEKHANPNKCRYQMQQRIWQWTRRKQQYQKKLSKLTKR